MRVRLGYTKAGKVRWTSHRDLARMFERAFRRTQLPIAYSGQSISRTPRVAGEMVRRMGGLRLNRRQRGIPAEGKHWNVVGANALPCREEGYSIGQ